MIIYLDGAYLPKEEAKVSVFDHGLLYGDGVFEGIRAYNGRVFRLDEHLDRLYDSAKTIDLTVPITKDEMAEAILETLRRNNLKDGYIRPIVTRGVGDLGLDPRKCPRRHGHHHRRRVGRDVRRPLREGPEGGLGLDPEEPCRRPAAEREEPQLPQQHPRQDRGELQGRRRGDLLRHERLPLRGLGRQHLRRQERRDHHPAHAQQPPRGHAAGRPRVRSRSGDHGRSSRTWATSTSTRPTRSS